MDLGTAIYSGRLGPSSSSPEELELSILVLMLVTGARTETDLCSRLARKEIRRSGPQERAEVDGVVASVAGTGTFDLVTGVTCGWGASRRGG